MKIKRLAELSDTVLSLALIAVAIFTIAAALKIHNRWIKAGILAYEILP